MDDEKKNKTKRLPNNSVTVIFSFRDASSYNQFIRDPDVVNALNEIEITSKKYNINKIEKFYQD